MSIFKKIVSVLLVISIGLSFAVPSFAEETNKIDNPEEYADYLWDEGYEPVSAEEVVEVIQHFGKIFSFFTKKENEMETFNLTLDKFTSDLLFYIFDNSGFDLSEILTNLPDFTVPATIAVETFKIDTTMFREQMYLKKAEFDAQGNDVGALICHFLGAYFSVIEECEIYGQQTEEEHIYELCLKLTYLDGSCETVRPGIFVNTLTGECTNKDDSGMLGIGFNYSLTEMTLYATVNCWMRDFGFCLLYDVVANMMPVVYKYETRRFKFDYDGLQWMVQIWKGNYFVANGSEVGLYSRSPKLIGSFYECATDEQMVRMSMDLYYKDKLLMSKPLQEHWWINGFHMSGRVYEPSKLTMKFTIEFPDEEMRDAFCKSVKNHYKKDVTYTVDGLKVNVVW